MPHFALRDGKIVRLPICTFLTGIGVKVVATRIP
jgi:hypothetical protein